MKEKKLTFKIGDATAYSEVLKELIIEAKAIQPYGVDMAKLLLSGREVDLDAIKPSIDEVTEVNEKKRVRKRKRTKDLIY